jgi:predicted CXXCH cytochrome family protein
MLTDPENTKNLWAGDISSFCIRCHYATPPAVATDKTKVVPYTVSFPVISTISSPFFPGWDKSSYLSIPAGMSATNICKTCHHPHGSNNARLTALNLDNTSLYSEEKLCLACHTLGGPAGAADINTQLAKTYKHPVDTVSGVHKDTEDYTNLSYDPVSSTRHSECVDCHNSHEATAATASPPAAKGVLKGIGGIRSEGTPINPILNQYELCFKCHSSYVTLPPGQLDKSYQFSTLNASYHPVESVGKNTGLKPGVFVSPWTETSLVYCTDCHGNDDPLGTQCVVGSANQYILKKPYTPTDTSLCFGCHNQDSYSVGDPSRSLSRWQKHRVSGHQNCIDCHNSHGTNQYHLINRGYNHAADGGSIVTDSTCVSTGCHREIGEWIPYTTAY